MQFKYLNPIQIVSVCLSDTKDTLYLDIGKTIKYRDDCLSRSGDSNE